MRRRQKVKLKTVLNGVYTSNSLPTNLKYGFYEKFFRKYTVQMERLNK